MEAQWILTVNEINQKSSIVNESVGEDCRLISKTYQDCAMLSMLLLHYVSTKSINDGDWPAIETMAIQYYTTVSKIGDDHAPKDIKNEASYALVQRGGQRFKT